VLPYRKKSYLEFMSFEDLGLNQNILRAIADCGYTTPTPIQAQAIPIVLMCRDLVGLAQTGTGKTASFTLPMIEILAGGRARARMPRSLILSPTRELAAQIAENFDLYGKYHKMSKALLVGGSSMEEQVKLLERGVDVLIATPGRLIDLFERGKILLTDIKILVIDEADRMMDMGFIPDIEKIVSLLPPIRQTLLFSATMPPEIRKLTTKFLSNPREVSVAPPATTADRIQQFLVWTSPRNKKETLEKLIEKENVEHAIIFCNRKRDVDDLAKWLARGGFSAKPMHGDMDQKSRTQTLQDFKDRKIKLLICSDVAARGLDVDDLSHVFNFDVPFHADDYVHRIGRTGRAGKTGQAWMLATQDEEKLVIAIETLIKKKIPVSEIAGQKSEKQKSDQQESPKKDSPRKDSQRPPQQKQNNNQNRPNQDRSRAQPRPTYGQSNYKPRQQENPGSDKNVVGFGDSMPGFFGKKDK
jgi:superfamily II DNA/RNA helicase